MKKPPVTKVIRLTRLTRLTMTSGRCAWLLTAACALLALHGNAARAQVGQAVIWLESGVAEAPGGEATEAHARRLERERALQLELQARQLVLLTADSVQHGDSTREAAARLAEQARAVAVLWLEGEDARPVSWLYAQRPGGNEPLKAPLPHPPETIDAQLLALAAASLIDQVLREAEREAQAAAVVPSPQAAAASVVESPPPAVQAPQPLLATPETDRAQAPPRYFAQLGFVLPLVEIFAGMPAASTPAPQDVYFEQAMVSSSGARDVRYYFFDDVPIVPDADSFDDFEGSLTPRGTAPVSRSCKADGKVTRLPELPSSYCVRVGEPEFVPMPALRLAVGMWITPVFSAALVYQWSFTITPENLLGNQSLAVESQYLLLGERSHGFALAALGALAVGRVETPVKSPHQRHVVHAYAGPLEASAGLALRYALQPAWALVTSAQGSARFPAGQLGVGLSLAMERGF